MKLLFARCCGDVVVPYSENYVVRWRQCGGAACWWDSGEDGSFAVYSSNGIGTVSVIGLHNGLLMEPCDDVGHVSAKRISELIKDTPDNYLFKKLSSLIIKFKPGSTGDTRFVSSLLEVPLKEQQGRMVTLMPRSEEFK